MSWLYSRALFDDDLGALVPCAQEECPHLDKQMDEPLWKDGQGRDVYLRRLKSLPANPPAPRTAQPWISPLSGRTAMNNNEYQAMPMPLMTATPNRQRFEIPVGELAL